VSGRLDAPRSLLSTDDLSQFDSGEPELDAWLKKRALLNEAGGASRTYVVCEHGKPLVVAYYSLATGAVQRSTAPGRVRRNMPEPIPVMVLGRLAVGRRHHGQGIGKGLLRDAVLRTLQAADIAGIRALLVHALSLQARSFYEAQGFQPSPIDANTLMILLSEAKRALET
jgi:GNAT superfamily N-acetyltransferase